MSFLLLLLPIFFIRTLAEGNTANEYETALVQSGLKKPSENLDLSKIIKRELYLQQAFYNTSDIHSTRSAFLQTCGTSNELAVQEWQLVWKKSTGKKIVIVGATQMEAQYAIA